MACKFRAANMPSFTTTRFRHALAVAALLAAAWPVAAEKADRSKPMVIEASKPGIVDLQRQVVVFNGDVVIAQGTLEIRGDRVELREGADGQRTAVASGAPGQPATYRQKRDGVNETVTGSADRIEYDGRAETLRFVGNGIVRRLRGSAVADEITGALIVWDHAKEQFRVEGSEASAGTPAGRVRAVLTPRSDNMPASGTPR